MNHAGRRGCFSAAAGDPGRAGMMGLAGRFVTNIRQQAILMISFPVRDLLHFYYEK